MTALGPLADAFHASSRAPRASSSGLSERQGCQSADHLADIGPRLRMSMLR